MKKHLYALAPVFLLAAGTASVHAQLQTNTPPVKPKAVWKSTAAAGLTLTSGNSETTLATLSAGTDRKTDQDEWTFGTDGAYGRSKAPGQTVTTTTAELLHGFSQFNWLFGDRVYGFGRTEAWHDGVADIRYRIALTAGAGYYFVKNTNTDLSAEAGPGYVFQKLGDSANSYATVRFGEKFHQALSDRARLWQTAELLPQLDKFRNYVVNAEFGIEADLNKSQSLALRSYVTDTFNNEPAPGRKKNDVTWVTAIAYKF